MGRGIAIVLSVGILLTVVSTTPGIAVQHYVQVCLRANSAAECPGHVEIDAGGSVAPKKLPSHESVPVSIEVHARVGIEGGGHPPALREGSISVAEGLAIDPVGLPACSLRQLKRSGIGMARRHCRKAIIGSGVAHIGFASSDTTLEAPLTIFNGGTSGGETRVFVHSAIAAPGLMPLVAIGKIARRGDGLTSVWRIPRILEGDGSVLDFRFRVSRRFRSEGRQRSYLAGRCPGRGGLRVNVPKVLFRNDAKDPGVAVSTTLKGSFVAPCS
jgi:hypothetical protein